jgi:F0F1-type ATP synthase membrane subunit b/b'
VALRLAARRRPVSDLECARRMVTRAERQALERAEELRAQAEALLKATSSQTVDAEARVKMQYEEQLRALRAEMEQVGRRATAAECELDLLRSCFAELRARAREAGLEVAEPAPAGAAAPVLATSAPAGEDPPFVGLLERMNLDADRLMEAANATVLRLRAQAELELARARQEAVSIVQAASQEAEDLLKTTLDAIDRDNAIASAAREQAESDGAAAAALFAEAEAALAKADEQAGEVVASARAEAEQIVAAGRAEAERTLAEAHDRAVREAQDIRRRLSDEIRAMRAAMDRTRDSLEAFLEAATPPETDPMLQ